jgi:hypothetical protein
MTEIEGQGLGLSKISRALRRPMGAQEAMAVPEGGSSGL